MRAKCNMGERFAVVAMVWCCALWMAAPAQAQNEAGWRQSERIGAQLYALDRAAQAAYEAGEDVRSFRRDDKILDWVAEHSGSDYQITFVGEARDGTPIALYQVRIGSSGVVIDPLRRLDKSPLPGQLAAQYQAGKSAAGVEHTACSSDYQTLVVRDGESGQQDWQVYLLPLSSYPDVIIFGGSYRVDVTPNGDSVRTVTALAAEGCSVLPNPPDAAALQQDGAPEAGPNELHVYRSLQAGKPLYVVSANNTWLIQDGRIRHMPGGVPGA